MAQYQREGLTSDSQHLCVKRLQSQHYRGRDKVSGDYCPTSLLLNVSFMFGERSCLRKKKKKNKVENN